MRKSRRTRKTNPEGGQTLVPQASGDLALPPQVGQEVARWISKEFLVYGGHTRRVTSVAFSPEGGVLASGSVDKTVKLWEARTGRLLQTLEGHHDIVYFVAFSPEGGVLYNAG